jgi:hypothetical protein
MTNDAAALLLPGTGSVAELLAEAVFVTDPVCARTVYRDVIVLTLPEASVPRLQG